MALSPQHLVTPAQIAARPGIALIWACWLWLGGSVVAALLAGVGGGDQRALAEALALTVSPALAGFLLFPRLGKPTADAGWIASWILMATGLAAGGGGPVSPLSAAFLIGPAVAAAIRPAWVQIAGGAAVAGYALAAWLAHFETGSDLRSFPAIMTAISISFATGLFSIAAHGRSSARGAAGRRVAEVSHELRTPLNHILGFSEMIERQMFGEIGARYVDYAGLIRRSGAHLLALVNDLLDLSKIEAGRYALEIESFDASEVAAEVVRLAADSAERKSILLGLVTPLAPLAVRADSSALRRMLFNTVGNAIKFTPEGGRVLLTISSVDGQLQLDTDDSGPGIAEADRARLGRSYERGSGESAEGTGLGLALVRALAELHGGTLSFHASAEGGALVRIRLPVLSD